MILKTLIITQNTVNWVRFGSRGSWVRIPLPRPSEKAL
nr:MAG TPA: Periplasmic domain of Sensor histidine kinase [Caudoviricetes sp.]